MPIRSGKMYFCKLLGPGVKNFDGDGLEWAFEFAVDDATLAEMEKEGVRASPKNKGDERGDFYKFAKNTVNKDGNAAKPIEVLDKTGKPWDPMVLIGNGSKIDVKYLLKEFEYKGKKGVKRNVLAVRVVDHVPYEGGEREDFKFDEEWS